MPDEVPSPDAPPAKPQRITKFHMRQLLKQYELALYQHTLTFEVKQKSYYRMSRVAPLKDRSRLIILIDRLEAKVNELKYKRNMIAAVIAAGGRGDYEEWRPVMELNQIDLTQAPSVLKHAVLQEKPTDSSELEKAS